MTSRTSVCSPVPMWGVSKTTHHKSLISSRPSSRCHEGSSAVHATNILGRAALHTVENASTFYSLSPPGIEPEEYPKILTSRTYRSWNQNQKYTQTLVWCISSRLVALHASFLEGSVSAKDLLASRILEKLAHELVNGNTQLTTYGNTYLLLCPIIRNPCTVNDELLLKDLTRLQRNIRGNLYSGMKLLKSWESMADCQFDISTQSPSSDNKSLDIQTPSINIRRITSDCFDSIRFLILTMAHIDLLNKDVRVLWNKLLVPDV